MRLVLDTNVVLAALLWSGPPNRLIELASEGLVDLLSSDELLAELADVLTRQKFEKKLAEQNTSPAELVSRYEELVEIVAAPSQSVINLRDLDDAIVTSCALAARADLIVSGDRDLQALVSYQGIPVVSPAQAMQRLSSAPTQGSADAP